MNAVDGLWWDSRKVLPDNCITLRRNLSIGPVQLPGPSETPSDSQLPPGVRAECKGSRGPLPLRIPESIGEVRIASVASLELDLDDWSEQAGFPFPRPPSRSLTSADFPALAEAARAGMQRALGDDCDHPGKVEMP
ncbi:MAG: DUF4056 domain-containing protein [Polyangiaceae bacterium]